MIKQQPELTDKEIAIIITIVRCVKDETTSAASVQSKYNHALDLIRRSLTIQAPRATK